MHSYLSAAGFDGIIGLVDRCADHHLFRKYLCSTDNLIEHRGPAER
jgi:hypothetical protein